MSNELSKEDAIIEGCIEQLRDDLHANYSKILRAAEETFRADEDAGNPEAKIGIAIAFDPMAEEPEIDIKVSWSARFAVENTVKIDRLQEKLPFEDTLKDAPEGTSVTVSSGGKDTVITKTGNKITREQMMREIAKGV